MGSKKIFVYYLTKLLARGEVESVDTIEKNTVNIKEE